ncbi:globin family protein [Iodobacter sp. LRB]|uniref:Hemoglobin-like flavoprotein n=2 Tax=Iodobacter TaxID=32014 RepID=A0A377SUJ3_9NEIS|nr:MULTISPECIES: globin family protein [Iodobacter]NHQ85732.1 hemin receptor [Iodobacter violacea]PHV02943.1 hemin receptor [Iodobacter sp. BJB302]TCU88223.1 hemoglobin-like flavoprotein [Iodobacter fluviatilis]STR45724.1 Soluble cytochrome O [Iodobacter fluviatilis]
MPLSDKDISLVKETLALVLPIADTAAEMFYQHLFEIAPEVKPLFKGDIKKQGAMLMTSIKLAVDNINKPEILLPAIQKLGERHAHYHVQEEHYTTVGQALLWTLEQGLADAFTSDVKSAWAATYTTLACEMIKAQRGTA